MSTSPSWFDQEKFSRLVKKVGPKTAPEASPAPPAAQPESRPAPAVTPPQPQSFAPDGARPPAIQEPPREPSLASTAHISLVSKPPSLLSEQRALPTLPRRTMPLPALKSLFPSAPAPIRAPSAEEAPAETPSTDSPVSDTFPAAESDLPVLDEQADMADAWQKISQLNEQLAHTIQERDQAVNEGILLREQLRQSDEDAAAREGGAAPSEELSRITKERDDAQAEAKDLRDQLSKAPEGSKDMGSADQAKEISLLTEERDQSRREYAALRGQFETLKQEQSSKDDSGKARKDLDQQLEGLRQKLEEKTAELATLKANPSPSSGSPDEATEKLREEAATLREQLTRAKEETSVAQRGLALSQKALHETRDTLREATEGTSLSRHNFDNLKNECATLVQQNAVLQAQNEQLLRDLAAAKSKMTSRL
jgi:hypothetical protein